MIKDNINGSCVSRQVSVLMAAGFLIGSAICVAAQDEPRRALPVNPDGVTEIVPRSQPANRPLVANAEDDLFNYATMAYEKRYFVIAEKQFSEYLKDYPAGAHADGAWFRLGECYLKQDQYEKAEECYSKVIRNYKEGDFVGSSSYRLGSLAYNRNEFKSAEPFFALAYTKSNRDEIKIPAAYYRGRCLKEVGNLKESIASFQLAAAKEKDNPYREVSMLEIARMEAESGNKEGAMTAFGGLIDDSTRPAVKGEAMFKSGILAAQAGKQAEAREFFKKTLEMKGAEDWKPDAQFNLIEAYYAEGDYKNVITTFTKGIYPMSDELRPKMLLMVGNAYRHEEKFASAIDIYLNVERYFGETNEAVEAAYRKLLCFFSLKNPNLPEFVDEYANMMQQRDPGNEYIDMAILLKGETYFDANSMGQAAEAYDRIRLEKVPEKLRASLLYKKGWAHAENGAPAKAIEAFGQFLDKYPEDSRAANALAKRGIAFREVEDLTSALNDFENLIKNYPDSDVRELAFQQVALIRGQQRNYEAMVSAYEALLQNFPKTVAAAEAYFWIGWGNFEQRKFQESIEPLKMARKLNTKDFFDRSSLRIVLAYRSLEDPDNARKEIDIIRDAKAAVVVPQQVYAWLGVRYFERKDYGNAVIYLTLSSNETDPTVTQPVIWKTLGEARFLTEKWAEAIKAFDYYLASNQPSAERAKVLNLKAQALMKSEKYADADLAVAEGIKIQPEGRTSAQLCLTWGQISFAQKNYKDAVRRLVRPSYVFDDEEITPFALDLSAKAHDALDEKEKAAEVRKKLKDKFPNFKESV